MTHTTTTVVDENTGTLRTVVVDVDVTALDAAASEPLSLADALGFRKIANVSVGAVETAGTHAVAVTGGYDLAVHTLAGDDPGAGTDIGTVRLTVVGDPGV